MRVQIRNDEILAWGDAVNGADTYDAPDDYSPEKYRYISVVFGEFNPLGFIPITLSVVDFGKRQSNINAMNQYMSEQGLTEANFNLFLNDVALVVQGYLGGGSRLITWIETVNRNGYNATAIGFKTKTGYRGALLSGTAGALGEYQRVTDILAILNNL